VASLLVLAAGAPASAETVLCQSSHASTCSAGSGCEPDRRRAALFTVDRAAGHVTDADGNRYAIERLPDPAPGAERAILATSAAGSSSETILIGERSFLASHVSIAPARVSVQVGTCEGLERSAPPP
jgi:hypothetical protein